MTITRTPKKKDDNIFAEIPTAEIFEDVDNENERNKPEGDDRYEALAKQMADLQTRLSESERANMALSTQPQWRSQVTDNFSPQDPTKVALPDPALDPDGYDKALAERNRIRADNERQKQDHEFRQQQTIKEKVENLWEAFGEKYPDMAEDKDRIDFVSTQIAKEVQKRGVDVERYMFITQDRFLDDVAKRYVKIFGEPNVENENEDFEEPAPRRQRTSKRREDRDDNSRTGGIFGGNESGGRTSRQKGDDESGPSMIDDMQAMQRKTGFY